ncbi:MAG: AbrB family transcriptional regulator [Deltaproteobacteria bacterium]|jgi:membrane AbrB-like protein|nr:AbrB family transcriptional regulator [Deltaproteobacteria bacterium]
MQIKLLHWGILGILTLILALPLEWIQLSAAPLISGIAAAIMLVMLGRGQDLTMNKHVFYTAQGVVGCMIGSYLSFPVLKSLLVNWPLALSAVVSVIICSYLLGWIMTVKNMLPGNTAIWGSSPGGAYAMTIMSENYGADIRLVALMQYLRVLLITVGATLVVHFMGVDAQTPAHNPQFFLQNFVVSFIEYDFWKVDFIYTILLVGVGVFLGLFLRIPSGALLVPLFAGAILQNTTGMQIILPPWLLLCSFVLLGWNIGLRFTPAIFKYALHVLPRILFFITALLLLCGAFALLLSLTMDIDLLSAYLATSPGGADAIAIITASSRNVDKPFIMAIQMLRVIIVLLIYPSIARLATNMAERVRAKKNLRL